jgi:hypothetical protein
MFTFSRYSKNTSQKQLDSSIARFLLVELNKLFLVSLLVIRPLEMSFAEKLSDGNQRVSSLSKYLFPKTDSFMTAANFERAFQRILLLEGDLRMNISGYRHLVVVWATTFTTFL